MGRRYPRSYGNTIGKCPPSSAPSVGKKFAFAGDAGLSRVRNVKWLKTGVTLLLLAVWLPASSHAFLQYVGFIHQTHEHDDAADADRHSDADHHPDAEHPHEHDADTHAAADGLCVASTAKVQLEQPILVAAPYWLAVAALICVEIPSASEAHSGLSPPGVAPPDLSPRWQFSFRTALPVRAPSIPS